LDDTVFDQHWKVKINNSVYNPKAMKNQNGKEIIREALMQALNAVESFADSEFAGRTSTKQRKQLVKK
jgi:hypothetical protein